MKSKIPAYRLVGNPFAGHLTTAQWAEEHISHEFNHHILLAPRDLAASYNTDRSFDTDFFSPRGTAPNVNVQAIETLLPDDISKVDLLQAYLTQTQNTMSGAGFFFHGTTHQFALDIVPARDQRIQGQAWDGLF